MSVTRSTEPLSGPALLPADGQAPDYAVVLLHGLGADGNDLLMLGRHWSQTLPRAAFFAPNAPYPCDMAPVGHQWFSLADRAPDKVEAGVRAAAPLLNAYLDQVLMTCHLTPDRLALVGFSQGTMMSLFVGPRRPVAPRAILGYSGALIAADSLAKEGLSKPDTLLIHGDADEIVPVAASHQAGRALEAYGAFIQTVIRPGIGHSIDMPGLELGGQFLADRMQD